MGTAGKSFVVRPSNCSIQMFGFIIWLSLLFPVKFGFCEHRHQDKMQKQGHCR